MSKGLLVVYSGASGVGKGTIMKELLKADGNIRLSISATTRKARPGETHGVEYFFISREEFEEMIKGDGFLEYAKYCDNYYGTPQKAVYDMLDSGIDVFLEIDVQGGMQIMEKCPECISIFIMPPSVEELSKRLHGRGTEPKEVIAKRLDAAQSELPLAKAYDYTVVNDDVIKARDEILQILKREKEKREHKI